MKSCALLRDPRGNVAIVFAIVALVVTGSIGGAVEYTRASGQRAGLQSAVDAAALSLTTFPGTATAADLRQAATSMVAGIVKDTSIASSLSVSASRSGTAVTVSATGQFATPLASLLGRKAVAVGATSTAQRGSGGMRVSLILDLTNSMTEDGKFPAMQKAARNLLARLQSATAQPGDTYVSIVPFRRSVNVGPSNSGQGWLRFSGQSDTWDENNGRCSTNSYDTKSSCVAAGRSWTPDNHSGWNGCVMDRDQSYDVVNTAPAMSLSASLFPAYQDDQCPPPVVPLTSNWSTLNSFVNTMAPATASAGTSQPIGLAHGWQSLAGTIYPIPALDPSREYQQSIVMLSDGLNTIDRWYDWHIRKTDADKIDARQRLLCDNIKKSGITIYSVHINTGGDPVSSVLSYCASGSDKFWQVTKASQTDSVLQQIATSLTATGPVRITH